MRRGILLLVCSALFVTYAYAAQTQGGTGQQGGKKCGSVGYNLQSCDCVGATAVCVVDSSHCPVPSGVYPIAYVNVGRCKSDCPAGGVGRGGLKASEGGWDEPWINLKSKAGVDRAERLIQQAKMKGFQAIDPDNTAEAVDVSDIKMIVDIAHKYGMKVSAKNEEGVWAQFLNQYPQYRQNIVMATAEECASHGDCGKYGAFTQRGIPVNHIEYADRGGSHGRLQNAIATAPGAGMLVPVEKHLRGVTNLGQVCVDPNGLTPGPGPTPEQLAALSQGQQPYQSTAQQPSGQWAAPSPATSSYNPGAGPWKQTDFDRLQTAAQPSFLDPNKPLPKTGNANPFANPDDWKDKKPDETKKVTTPKKEPTAPAEPAKAQETTFYDPLGGTPGSTPKQDIKARGSGAVLAKPFGSARIKCMPNNVLDGEKPTIAWSCGKDATGSVGVGFDSRNYLLGSTRLTAHKTNTYAVNCYDEETLVGSAQCTVTVRQEKSGDESFYTGTKNQYTETPKALCFLTFCL